MQNEVRLETNDDDLNITYGLIDFGPERELARASVRYILTDMNDIRRSYLRLGFHLYEFANMKYYRDFGYASMNDFCAANLGLDQPKVSKCINVYLEFTKVENGQRCHLQLAKQYEDFSYSQLCEMLPLSKEKRLLVSPGMTIKQIRALKKSDKASDPEDLTADSDLIELQLLDQHGAPIKKYFNKPIDVIRNDSGKIVLQLKEV